MKLKIILLISILLFITLASSSFGQDDSESIHFDIDMSTPMIEHGRLFDWDGRFTNPGAVLYHDGMFHMFRPGFREWGQDTGIAYMTSEDGLNWSEYSEDPIFTQSEVPFGTVAMPTTALVEDNGTWVMYFFLVPLAEDQPSGIARATADQPQGPWTMDEEIVLGLGSEGEWDSALMPAPQVLKTDNQYLMYYGGQWDDSGDTYIGMATSDDGIAWTKYDDPSTTDAPFAESDPIFFPDTSEDTWEYPTSVQAPRVIQTPDGFVMLYSSFNGMRSGGFRGYGMAISYDGLNWERVSDEPVFSTQESNGRDTWFPALAYNDGTYYMYVSIDSPRGGTFIYGGIYSGSLFP